MGVDADPEGRVSVSPSKRPVVFLDRDGVLVRAYVRDGVTHPPAHLGEAEVLEGASEGLARLDGTGFALVIVTNQPDVARGLQSRERVEEINDHLLRELPLLGAMTCYHDTPDGCACRKPKPGMLLEAARRWGLDLSHGFLIGDRWSDVVAAQAAGCRGVLLENAYSGREKCRPDHQVRGLVEAAEWILNQSSGGAA